MSTLHQVLIMSDHQQASGGGDTSASLVLRSRRSHSGVLRRSFSTCDAPAPLTITSTTAEQSLSILEDTPSIMDYCPPDQDGRRSSQHL